MSYHQQPEPYFYVYSNSERIIQVLQQKQTHQTMQHSSSLNRNFSVLVSTDSSRCGPHLL